MKICLLADTYPPDVGGLAVSVRRNAGNLARAGHTVHVVSPDAAAAPGTWHTADDGPPVVHRFGPGARRRETLAAWFDGIAALHVRHEFDLFHGHFIVYAGYVAVAVARYLGKPAVISARGNDLDVMPFDDRRAPFVFKALEWADAVVAVTRDLGRKAQALSGRTDVRVIHNGVDAQRFAPQASPPALRATLQLDERPVIGFTGEARAKKGLGRMLRVFARLNETVAAHLLLVGGVRKDDRAMVEFFRQQHPDLSLHVVPPQPNEALPPYYALCDVVILPSLRDGLPNTLLEAMACGRPVIASAVGGMLDVLTDGVDGILLPPADDSAWLDALRHLLHDPQKREQLGAAARQTVLTRFTTEQELDATLALYHEVVAAHY